MKTVYVMGAGDVRVEACRLSAHIRMVTSVDCHFERDNAGTKSILLVAETVEDGRRIHPLALKSAPKEAATLSEAADLIILPEAELLLRGTYLNRREVRGYFVQIKCGNRWCKVAVSHAETSCSTH